MGIPIKTRALNFLVCANQFTFCILTLGGSAPDETMSSAAYRMERDDRFWGFMRPVIDTLARPWQKDHCKRAYESELLRLQYAAEFRAVRDLGHNLK